MSPFYYKLTVSIVGIVAAGTLGFILLRRFFQRVEGEIRSEADKHVDSIVAMHLAKRLNVPEAQVSEVMNNPEANLSFWHSITDAIQTVTITARKASAGIVQMTVQIQWNDDDQTNVEEQWNWEDVPAEVRKQLIIQNAPVDIVWEFPDLSKRKIN